MQHSKLGRHEISREELLNLLPRNIMPNWISFGKLSQEKKQNLQNFLQFFTLFALNLFNIKGVKISWSNIILLNFFLTKLRLKYFRELKKLFCVFLCREL